MKRLVLATLLVVGVMGSAAVAADDSVRGTTRDAQIMVERGILAFDNEGAADAFAAINMAPPAFRDHDLYLFVIDTTDGLLVANALHPEQVGTDVMDLKDVDDTPFIRNMVGHATKYGVWVDYKYENPTNGQVEPKSSWVVLHDGYVFGCGIYKP